MNQDGASGSLPFTDNMPVITSETESLPNQDTTPQNSASGQPAAQNKTNALLVGNTINASVMDLQQIITQMIKNQSSQQPNEATTAPSALFKDAGRNLPSEPPHCCATSSVQLLECSFSAVGPHLSGSIRPDQTWLMYPRSGPEYTLTEGFSFRPDVPSFTQFLSSPWLTPHSSTDSGLTPHSG